VRSRWLNAVSARLSPSDQRRVRRLPFVDRLEPVAVHTAPTGGPASEPARALPPLLVKPPGPAVRLAAGAGSGPGRASSAGSATPPDGCARAPEAQLGLINALAPLRRGINGSGVRIGFMDTRFRGLRHEAFDAMRRDGRILALRDFTNGPQTNNHGAAVVSVAAGSRPDLFTSPAPGAEVLGATTEYTPFERRVEEDFFVAGLEWLERQGADVVNVSIGYTRFDSTETSYTTDDLDGDTAVTTRAVDAAARLGVAVVVSAGNSGCGDPSNCWYYVSTPADADSAITVGAVAADSTVALFSSRGPTADGRIKPDVAAAGRGVCAAWGPAGYRSVNGTSFASPLVAGVVAQMLQVAPDLGPMEVRRLLRTTASQPDRPDPAIGWGIVNADSAVRAAERRARMAPPATLTARPPYPNPASEQAWFQVRAPAGTGPLEVSVYDVLGRRRITTKRVLRPGPNRISIDVSDLPAGVYLYRLQGERVAETGRLTVLR
jgi:subtilisin family serine protease